MEWKNNGGVVQDKNESSGNNVKYTYITKLTPADNKEVFTCRTNFDEAQRPMGGRKPATNIPTTDNVLTNYTSFVPTLAVSKRKQLDRVKPSISPQASFA